MGVVEGSSMATGININLRAVRARLRARTGPAGTQEVLAGGVVGRDTGGTQGTGGTQLCSQCRASTGQP